MSCSLYLCAIPFFHLDVVVVVVIRPTFHMSFFFLLFRIGTKGLCDHIFLSSPISSFSHRKKNGKKKHTTLSVPSVRGIHANSAVVIRLLLLLIFLTAFFVCVCSLYVIVRFVRRPQCGCLFHCIIYVTIRSSVNKISTTTVCLYIEPY